MPRSVGRRPRSLEGGTSICLRETPSFDECTDFFRSPPKSIKLEDAIGYVAEDELIEVTPSAIRLRKAELASSMRRRASRQASA